MNSANKEIQLHNVPKRDGYLKKENNNRILYWGSPGKTRKTVHMEHHPQIPNKGSSPSCPSSLLSFFPCWFLKNSSTIPAFPFHAQLIDPIKQKPKLRGWQNEEHLLFSSGDLSTSSLDKMDWKEMSTMVA